MYRTLGHVLRSALISGLWQENLRDTDGWRK